MTEFIYEPSKHVPFRDIKVLEKVREIKREDIENHSNIDYKIRVVPDADLSIISLFDAFHRIKTAADNNDSLVMIMPNPWPQFRMLAHMLNKFHVDCRKLHTFNMDEYADQDGNIAPESWKYGFGYAFKKYFYHNLNKNLRPPEKQIHTFTNENINDYGQMITDLGEADIVYSGPGWTGHLAFIEPDAPEFQADSMEEWMQMGPRVATLSPFTLAQNSMHGSFGMSGDLAIVPPKAATIGPAQVVKAKNRMQTFGISVHGTATSWQRLIARLVMHGNPTPLVPESVNQLLRTDAYVTETIAMNIEADFEKGY
jgi:6-phosphogluconolactonase/glucosamine-6-phosphate isomerase/deaminase